MNNLDPILLGQVLYYRGFRDWFLYLFKHINGQPFIIEKFHEEMFKEVRHIIEGKESRVCFNIFPRSAKTTFMTWLCIYAILTNPKSQIIYTSYSQELLRQVSKNIADIMQHPIFKAMYPSLKGHQISEEEVNPTDDFWRSYVIQQTGKPTFSARKITTPQGGIILFSSIGSSLTGFGASIRGAKGFTGMLCIDDPDNATTIRSQRIRQKTQTYFAEVLLSRLNNPDAPIVLIQQRLHQDDFTAYVTKHYPFKVLKFPLLDKQGNCICLSQYTEQRIKELQVNNYVFQAQYMQSPVPLSGGVFKREWFRFYQDMEDTRYRRIFITADTACKTNEWNDFTAIGVWGLTTANRLRLLDLIHAKMEIPELQATFVAVWNKWAQGIGACRCTAVYIEEKSSGIQAIQQLKRIGGIPIVPFVPEKDKLTRALDAVPQVAAGNIELPGDETNPLSAKFLAEVLSFTADGSCLHDDITDSFSAAVREAYEQRGYF